MASTGDLKEKRQALIRKSMDNARKLKELNDEEKALLVQEIKMLEESNANDEAQIKAYSERLKYKKKRLSEKEEVLGRARKMAKIVRKEGESGNTGDTGEIDVSSLKGESDLEEGETIRPVA